MALLTDSPRSATITALRDSHVLFLSSDTFARVVQAHPHTLHVIAGALISTLMNTIRHGSKATPATSIVIVPLDESQPVRELGNRLAHSLEPLVGFTPVVHAHDMPAELRGRRRSCGRAAWREQLEAAHGAVVYVADPTFDRVDRRVRRAGGSAGARRGGGWVAAVAVEDELERRQGAIARRSELVLLHSPSTSIHEGRGAGSRPATLTGITTFAPTARATTTASRGCSSAWVSVSCSAAAVHAASRTSGSCRLCSTGA